MIEIIYNIKIYQNTHKNNIQLNNYLIFQWEKEVVHIKMILQRRDLIKLILNNSTVIKINLSNFVEI
jgi:hypothetical protein